MTRMTKEERKKRNNYLRLTNSLRDYAFKMKGKKKDFDPKTTLLGQYFGFDNDHYNV